MGCSPQAVVLVLAGQERVTQNGWEGEKDWPRLVVVRSLTMTLHVDIGCGSHQKAHAALAKVVRVPSSTQ